MTFQWFPPTFFNLASTENNHKISNLIISSTFLNFNNIHQNFNKSLLFSTIMNLICLWNFFVLLSEFKCYKTTKLHLALIFSCIKNVSHRFSCNWTLWMKQCNSSRTEKVFFFIEQLAKMRMKQSGTKSHQTSAMQIVVRNRSVKPLNVERATLKDFRCGRVECDFGGGGGWGLGYVVAASTWSGEGGSCDDVGRLRVTARK